MNSRKEKSDKSIVVKSEFHYGQTRMIVRVDGEREYDTTKLSTRTARRLLAVLESIPTSCRQVEFDSDFSPIVYLHWKAARHDAGLYPAAHPRPSVPAELAGDYDSFADFSSEVERLWSLDECLRYPCELTLSHALDLLRGLARSDGYDVLLPAYEKFVAVCKDDALLLDADMLLKDYAPVSNRDGMWYGLVRK